MFRFQSGFASKRFPFSYFLPSRFKTVAYPTMVVMQLKTVSCYSYFRFFVPKRLTRLRIPSAYVSKQLHIPFTLVMQLKTVSYFSYFCLVPKRLPRIPSACVSKRVHVLQCKFRTNFSPFRCHTLQSASYPFAGLFQLTASFFVTLEGFHILSLRFKTVSCRIDTLRNRFTPIRGVSNAFIFVSCRTASRELCPVLVS